MPYSVEFVNISKRKIITESNDLDKSINVAEVAKAYYIDRTLSQSDVQF